MICHKKKLIFIHIPKCAGSSINSFYFGNQKLNWKEPNYGSLHGWCPQRKIHLQHATAQELLETDLVSKQNWKEYFKFTFIRNPWDRAYSDYLWIQKDRKIHGNFKEYLLQEGPFDKVLNDKNTMEYRGDHVVPQSDFFSEEGMYKLDFVGRFENLNADIENINQQLSISEVFQTHAKKSRNRFSHYSHFYTNSWKKSVEQKYKNDIEIFGYQFDDRRKGLLALKKWL